MFAALLDQEQGGHWNIHPSEYSHVTRRYLPDSNVLETTFFGTSGTLVLTDFMPVSFGLLYPLSMIPSHELIRRAECTAGDLELEVSFVPRLGYGRSPLSLRDGTLGIHSSSGNGAYWLRSNCPLHLKENSAEGRVRMTAGTKYNFSFSYSHDAPAVLPPVDETIQERMRESVAWWQNWARRVQYEGEFRDPVVRSALALKLLTYVPSGAIIAAPTTSLPEQTGGTLNWDYRFCWLRDASLTIRALLGLGFWEEATDFLNWMLHATRLTQPELRVLYTVFGQTPPPERELTNLSGYRESRPVRIGNAARDQLQLDVYGEVVDAAAQYVFHGGTLDHDMQKALVGFGNYVCKHWDEPDEGIWEPRTAPQPHTHSRLLCWTALDRLISLQKQGAVRGLALDKYTANAELIRKQIGELGWNQSLGSYVSVLNGNALDASLLLLSWYGFESASSPRMQSTYRAVCRELGTATGLLYRYRTPHPEGTFALCSFWGIEFLALGGGTLQAAKQAFAQLARYANDLGLYAEEIEPASGYPLGNFPQAFTHVGLISAALSIAEREKGEQQLPHRTETATEHESAKVTA